MRNFVGDVESLVVYHKTVNTAAFGVWPKANRINQCNKDRGTVTLGTVFANAEELR